MTLKLLLVLVLTASLGAPVGCIFYRSNLSSDKLERRCVTPSRPICLILFGEEPC